MQHLIVLLRRHLSISQDVDESYQEIVDNRQNATRQQQQPCQNPLHNKRRQQQCGTRHHYGDYF